MIRKLDNEMIIINYSVYGLFFNYKYIPNCSYPQKVLKVYDEDLYFPKQIVINANITQTLLTILLNNDDKIEIGDDLVDLKTLTIQMDPYMKGLSICNNDLIRNEHNKLFQSKEDLEREREHHQSRHHAFNNNDLAVYQYVSYIHFKNSIYELDGLKEGPILIEKNVPFKQWISKVKPYIISRCNLYSTNEIKYQLLSVVPDRLERAKEMQNDLIMRKQYITALISGNEVNDNKVFSDYKKLSKEDLVKSLNESEVHLSQNELIINEEEDKINQCSIAGHQFNYIPFVLELIKIVNEKDIIGNDNDNDNDNMAIDK